MDPNLLSKEPDSNNNQQENQDNSVSNAQSEADTYGYNPYYDSYANNTNMSDGNNANISQDNQPKKTLAIISLILGIVALLLSCMWCCCYPLGIVAIILAIISLVKKAPGKKMAIWGIVLSVLACIIGTISSIGIYLMDTAFRESIESGEPPAFVQENPEWEEFWEAFVEGYSSTQTDIYG